MHTRSKWVRVSNTSPCPICKHGDWCCVSADGALAKCMRQEQGCWRSKTDRTGAAYYLHRLGQGSLPDSSPCPLPPSPATPRANPDFVHRAYTALLGLMSLSKLHRESLQQRGLSDAEIDRRGYRSLSIQGRANFARKTAEAVGDGLVTVPGFVIKPGKEGRPFLSIAGAAGLLIPVRDTEGRIVALLARRDDSAGGGSRYSYLSSTAAGGPGPGSPTHVPLGVSAPCEICRLTEGALKADMATALSGLPTIGAAGLTWRSALDALAALGCKTVRLSFDADALDKIPVARALADCQAALDSSGVAVQLERWELSDGKGIDDLLAAGKSPELLTGEAARAAIREAIASATAHEPPPSDGLERLADVMATGGAPALFADRPLLEAFARLATSDPTGYAARRATLKSVVSLRELDAVLKPFVREQFRERPPVLVNAAIYRVEGGCMVRERHTPTGPVNEPLCNFSAKINEVIAMDDGAEQNIHFVISGSLPNGRALPSVQVAAAEFPALNWVTQLWHGEAIVFAGQGTRDHVRVAIELLSPERVKRTVFTHTGWRKVDGDWFYLHSAGAIGAPGALQTIETALPGPLTNFRLFDPPSGQALRAAIVASLGLVNGLAPDRIAFPLLAAAFRATLGPSDFSVHFCGPTSSFKTELTALCQQHFGSELNARNLPGNWSSTGNALEGVAFAAKDAVVVVDDFAPCGSSADIQRSHREADRLLRAQGNRAGRLRMRPDGTVRPEKPPRGLIVSSGEDVPRGQSLRSRTFIVEVSPGDVPKERLTECQRIAAAGQYALAMSGFLQWLSPRYELVLGRLREEAAELRERARSDGQHARTPGIASDLALGLRYLLAYATETGAITAEESDRLWSRSWAALLAVAAEQAAHIGASEPTAQFLRLLSAAIASGRAHVAGVNGAAPDQAGAWGWRPKPSEPGEAWEPLGRRIGWLQQDELFLEPEAAYAEAQRLAAEQNDSLPVTERTLWKRLHERGLLQGVETHGERTRLTVRKMLEGQRRSVIYLRASCLTSAESAPSAPNSANSNEIDALQRRTAPGAGAPQCANGALECANGALGKLQCAAPSTNGDGSSDELAHLAHSVTEEVVTPWERESGSLERG
jgi:hypothetical protein